MLGKFGNPGPAKKQVIPGFRNNQGYQSLTRLDPARTSFESNVEKAWQTLLSYIVGYFGKPTKQRFVGNKDKFYVWYDIDGKLCENDFFLRKL